MVKVKITADPHNPDAVPRVEHHANLDCAVEYAIACGWTCAVEGAFVAGEWVVPPPVGAMVTTIEGDVVPALHPGYERRIVRVKAGVVAPSER
jgi:hypothetical protein